MEDSLNAIAPSSELSLNCDTESELVAWRINVSGEHILVIEFTVEDQTQFFASALNVNFIALAAKALVREKLFSKVESSVKFDKTQNAEIGHVGARYRCTLSDPEYEKEIQNATWTIVDLVPLERIVYEVLREHNATDDQEGKASIPEQIRGTWNIEIKTLENECYLCKLELNDELINLVFAERFGDPPFTWLSGFSKCIGLTNGLKQRVRRKYLRNMKPKAELIAAYFKDQNGLLSKDSTPVC